MKRCPECRRDYYDETLLYCLDDGSPLLDGPASLEEPHTALLPGDGSISGNETKTKLYEDSNGRAITTADRSRPGALVWVGAACVLALGGAAFLYLRSGPLSKVPASLPTAKITRLTSSGRALEAAISPDGKWVVYAQKDGAQQSLWMRQIATNSAIQIVPPADVHIGRQTFSPDGNYVYYALTDAADPSGVLYQAPTIGGPAKKILTGIDSPIAFSPDGKHIAFVRNDEAVSAEDQLMIANSDGSGERKLAARKGDEWFGFPTGCAWSPDGRTIACSGGRYKTQFNQAVILTDAETGEQKELPTSSFSDLGRLSWFSDGTGLVANAADPGSQNDQLWLLPYPSGEARKITNDLMDYGGTSLTSDGTGMVSVQIDPTSNLWIAAAGDLTHPKQITFGKSEGGFGSSGGLSFTPDGRLLYTSLSTGNPDIWIMKSDGTDNRQLTADPAVDVDAEMSPDGQYIVFVSDRGGTTGLWRMDPDGSNLTKLSDLDDHKPQISPDSKWIIFDSWRSQKRSLWKMPINGGDAVHLTEKFTSSCGISPDGLSVACFYREDEKSGSPWRIMILPFAGGSPSSTFDVSVQDTVPLDASVRWSPDGKALLYAASTGGIPNLWSQPIAGGAPKKITDFKDNGVWRFALSHDNRQVAFSRGSVTSDVVLFKDFK